MKKQFFPLLKKIENLKNLPNSNLNSCIVKQIFKHLVKYYSTHKKYNNLLVIKYLVDIFKLFKIFITTFRKYFIS